MVSRAASTHVDSTVRPGVHLGLLQAGQEEGRVVNVGALRAGQLDSDTVGSVSSDEARPQTEHLQS